MRRQASISGEGVCSLVGIAQEVWGVLVSVKRIVVARPLWVLPILRAYELLLCSLPVSQLTCVYMAAMTIVTHLTRDIGSLSGLHTFGYSELFMSKF